MSASFTLKARDVADDEDGWLSIEAVVDTDEINVSVGMVVSLAKVLKDVLDDVPWSRIEFVAGPDVPSLDAGATQ